MSKLPLEVGGIESDRLRTQRREFLRVGSLGMLGLSLPHLFAAEAAASLSTGERLTARAKSCIFLFLPGGPSQLETFDPKPDAPSDFKTIYRTIPTSVPGTFLCEHLEDIAKQADRFALIRTAWHKHGGHFGGHRYALTGHPAPRNADDPARPDDKPGMVSLAAKYLGHAKGLPSSVMVPFVSTDQGSGMSGGMGGGTLGRQYNPVLVTVEQNSLDKPGKMPTFLVPEFTLHPSVDEARFSNRLSLLGHVEQQQRRLAESAAGQEMNSLYQKATDLLTSPAIKAGFDIDQEPAPLRRQYGENAFGQSCLMARRLIERGARFVQVNMARYVTMPGYGWDTHDKGEETLKKHLLPRLNAGVGTLLSDLHDRGLLKETLVVVMGEFGRTPRVKKDGGRDHWPNCYSLLMAGGGVHGGLVYGKSDKTASYPNQDAVEARDILETVLTLLGIPTFVTDNLGRAAPLFEGASPIRRLYS